MRGSRHEEINLCTECQDKIDDAHVKMLKDDSKGPEYFDKCLKDKTYYCRANYDADKIGTTTKAMCCPFKSNGHSKCDGSAPVSQGVFTPWPTQAPSPNSINVPDELQPTNYIPQTMPPTAPTPQATFTDLWGNGL